ncbi:MAG: DUF1566 domain-containing protein [Deltaproteobacteria bacterium]|nr:DUF1566 domain-containing protein [Deltaproteobacteria bacterium]
MKQLFNRLSVVLCVIPWLSACQPILDQDFEASLEAETYNNTGQDAEADFKQYQTKSLYLSSNLPTDCTGLADMTPCSVFTYPFDRDYDVCIDGVCKSPGCGTSACNVPGPYFPLADTGQRQCFDTGSIMEECPISENDAFFGQDGQYGWDASHTADERYSRIFNDEQEPIVADNVTGLMWQGCTAGQSGDNCTSGAASALKWSYALRYCDSLTWGGYSDWRLPDDFALVSILDLGSYYPSVDADTFPVTMANQYWSSSTYHDDDRLAWTVIVGSGSTDYFSYKDQILYVRCVRGGTLKSQPIRFTRDTLQPNEPVVSDSVTELQWQGCSAGQSGNECDEFSETTMTWQEALDYCEKLTWADHNDWRLPNSFELQSIVDTRKHDLMIDEELFPETRSSAYWTSSTAYYRQKNSAWQVNFAKANIRSNEKRNGSYVRCVREEI